MEGGDAGARRGYWLAAAAQARAHRGAWLGLSLSALAIVAMLAFGLARVLGGAPPLGLKAGLLGSLAGFIATALGALPALALRRLPQKIEDVLLGGAAGMMLAASFFSLLAPSLAASAQLLPPPAGAFLLVLPGLALGVALMLGLDRFLPHEHDKNGPCGPAHEACPRLVLFVLAIALHNLPEGMAVGVGFAREDFAVGLPLAIGIALQNLPEGLAVALALRRIGKDAVAAVLLAAATGLMEPVGALFGLGLTGGFAAAYPLGLALAAGAMIFVVSHEVIPETHRNGHQTPATVGLMVGFALMLLLDQTF